MRRGELLALRWQDVDFERDRLAVVRAVEQTKAGVEFKQPKTARGRRSIVLPEMAVAALKTYRAGQAERRLAMGDAASTTFATRTPRCCCGRAPR